MKQIQPFRVGTWRNTRLADCPKNRFHQLLHWCLLIMSYTILSYTIPIQIMQRLSKNNSGIYFKGDNVQFSACNICRSPFRSSRARTLSWSSGSLPCSLGNQPIYSIALYYISCYLGSEPTKKSKYH